MPTHTLQADDLTVDTKSRQAWVSGREVQLTRKEYDSFLKDTDNLL